MTLVQENETLASEVPIPQTSKRIPSLDGWRAISIAMVILGHTFGEYHNIHIKNPLVYTVMSLLANGELGVLIFFVISGYLITTLLLKELDNTGSISLRDFYIRRSLRIFPAFYFYILIVSILWAAGKIHLFWSDYLPAITFFRDYTAFFGSTNIKGDWFVGHTWSLSVEEQFYWLWPLALILFKEKRARNFAIALIFIAPVIRVLQYSLTPDLRGQIGIMFHTRVDSLMTGCVIAILSREPGFRKFLDKAYRFHLPLIAAIVAFVIAPLFAHRYRGVFMLPVGFSLYNICVAMMLLWTVDNANSKTGSLLNSKVLVHIGTISYSLYLWQQMFLTPLNTTFSGMVPLNILCAFIVAELSYRFIESPILKLRKHYQHAVPTAPTS